MIVFYVCYISISVFIFIQVFICINYLAVTQGLIEYETFEFYDFLWSLLSFIIDTVLCVYLLYIFIKKLTEIIANGSHFHANDLFNVVAKYFILSSIGIISSELFYFIIFAVDIIGWQYGKDNISNYVLYACWILGVI